MIARRAASGLFALEYSGATGTLIDQPVHLTIERDGGRIDVVLTPESIVQ